MKNSCYELLLQKVNRQNKIVFYNHRIGIDRVLADIEGLCGAFVELGLKKGDVVSLYLPTCPQSVVAFYACSKLGLIANFIHPKATLHNVRKNLKKTGSKLLMFFDALVADESVFANLNQIVVRCSVADYEELRKPAFVLYSAIKCKKSKQTLSYASMVKNKTSTGSVGDGDDVVCYMHSGGTTGEAKIVALTNAAFNFAANGLFDCRHNIYADGYSLVTLPVFHAYGLCASVHFPLISGYGLALVPKFTAKWVKKYLNSLKVGFWLVVPSMLRKLINQNALDCKGLKNVVDIWCGGDFADDTLLQQVNDKLKKYGSSAKVLRGYGLTETCGACIACSKTNDRKNSCGVALAGTRAEIHDDDGNALPNNTLGEIVMYTPALMRGYIDGGENLSSDGGLKTGDIGYIDDDGFVFVVDRKKRSVKIAAINVFPSEIERCVCENLSFVSQCCVVGYKQQGKQYLKAFVVLDHSMPFDEVELAVKRICEQKLSPYSRPEQVEVVDEIPLTKIGKVDFMALEKRC